MNANLLRQVGWLWKHRHTHDDDTFQEQINIIRQTIETQEDSVAVAGTGAYLHLSREATQTIAVGGELIEWDTQNSVIAPFEFSVTLPVTEVPIPKEAYYDVRILGLEWVSFTGGGAVRVVRNPSAENETVWPPDDLWVATSGQTGKGTAPAIPFRMGDSVGVFLDPDDASTQDLKSAILVIDLVDRVTRTILYHQVVLKHAPIAYYRHDETSGTTAADTAGHASGPFDGTYTNGPTLNQSGLMKDGSGSPSVSFDGIDDSIEVGDQAALEFTGTDPFSVEAWIRLDAAAAAPYSHVIVHKEDYTAALGPNDGWVLAARTDAAGDVDFVFERWNGEDPAGLQRAETPLSYARDETHHVVGTYDGTDAKIFVDGVLIDTDSTAVSMDATTAGLQIGERTASAENTDGRIDEVAIYDRALLVAEVEEHYQVGSRFV